MLFRENENNIHSPNCHPKMLLPLLASGAAGESSSLPSRGGLYSITNFLFIVTMVLIDMLVDRKGHDPILFVIVLFAICSFPYVLATTMNGRYGILLIMMPILFIFYGANDILTYFYYYPSYWYGPQGQILTTAEIAVLSGIAMLMFGFYAASSLSVKWSLRWLVDDWRERPTIIVGLSSILIGIWATWTFVVSAGSRTHLGKLDPTMASFLVGGRMLEAVGAVLLSYAFLRTKKKALLFLILAIGLLKIPMGFFLDSKEVAISFMVIFILTKWVYDGGLPLRWVGLILVAIITMFPLFYAYRSAVVGEKHYSASTAAENASSTLDIAMNENAKSAEKGGSVLERGIQAFATRVDLKSLMELIVARVGNGVDFQNGNTLAALPYAFVPRILIPDKPNVPVGQLFNQKFHISSNPETFISTSFLGELYWNFGWSGLVLGMILIGASLGVVSTISNVQEVKTAPRLLLLISALYLLAFRFETGIAQQYTVFLRSGLIILLMHVLFRCRSVKNSQAF